MYVKFHSFSQGQNVFAPLLTSTILFFLKTVFKSIFPPPQAAKHNDISIDFVSLIFLVIYTKLKFSDCSVLPLISFKSVKLQSPL